MDQPHPRQHMMHYDIMLMLDIPLGEYGQQMLPLLTD